MMARRRFSGGRLPVGRSVRPSGPALGASSISAFAGSSLELELLSTIDVLELLLAHNKLGGVPLSGCPMW